MIQNSKQAQYAIHKAQLLNNPQLSKAIELLTSDYSHDQLQNIYISPLGDALASLLENKLKELLTYLQRVEQFCEIISCIQLRQKLYQQKKGRKKIKIIYFPIISDKNIGIFDALYVYIKRVNNQNGHQQNGIKIILASLLVQKKVETFYLQKLKSSNIFMVNLLTVEAYSQTKTLSINKKELVDKMIVFLSNKLKIIYQTLSFKDIYESYIVAIEKQKETLHDNIRRQKQLLDTDIGQKQVLEQQHGNLCGFHAFHNIKECQNADRLFSEEKFLENYLILNQEIEKHLSVPQLIKIPLFEPLQREDVNNILQSTLFKQRYLNTLFLSENYILNPIWQLEQLQNNVDKVKEGTIKQLFILMGVFNHYFVLKLYDKKKMSFMDSMNPPLERIMKKSVLKKGEPKKEDYRRVQDMCAGIKAIKDIFHKDEKIKYILARLRIDEVIDSYEKYNADNQTKIIWLKQYYPAPVIRNDLFDEIRGFKKNQIGEEHSSRLKQWLKEEFVIENIIKKEEIELLLKEMEIQ